MISAERRSVRLNDSRVEAAAVLDRSLLCLVVDVHDSEALGVAVAPLIVVEERPREIAAQINSLHDRIAYRFQMGFEVGDTQRILDPSIDCSRRICESRSI